MADQLSFVGLGYNYGNQSHPQQNASPSVSPADAIYQQHLAYYQQNQIYFDHPKSQLHKGATQQSSSSDWESELVAKSILEQIQAELPPLDFVKSTKLDVGDLQEDSQDQAAVKQTQQRPNVNPAIAEHEITPSQIAAIAGATTTPQRKQSRWGPKVEQDNQTLIESVVTESTGSCQISNLPIATFSTQPHTHRQLAPSTRILPPAIAREKRERFLRDKEEPRKHAALIRNFEYLHFKEEQRLQKQLEQLSNPTNLKASNPKATSAKHQALLTTKAGIGTKIRNAATKTFDIPAAGNKSKKPNATGVYVSGLTSATKESTLHELFEAFGPVQAVTLYKDKITGRIKGDALIVYKVDDTSNIDVKQLCGQVRTGAEPVFLKVQS